MKKISVILTFIGLVFIGGCIGQTNEQKKGVSFGSGFNEETYVWESLYFPTNRVMDRR